MASVTLDVALSITINDIYIILLVPHQAPATPPRSRRRPISIAVFPTPVPRTRTMGNDVDVMPRFHPNTPSLSVIGELKKRHGLGEDLKKGLKKVAPPPPPPTSTIPPVPPGNIYPAGQPTFSTFTPKTTQRRFVFTSYLRIARGRVRPCHSGRCNRVWI